MEMQSFLSSLIVFLPHRITFSSPFDRPQSTDQIHNVKLFGVSTDVYFTWPEPTWMKPFL